jgi:hypothetical protein
MGRFSELKIIQDAAPRSEEMRTNPEPKQKRVGKRDHPDYTQISVYIRKQPYHEAKRNLIGSDKDFSDLVNELLANWLSKGNV